MILTVNKFKALNKLQNLKRNKITAVYTKVEQIKFYVSHFLNHIIGRISFYYILFYFIYIYEIFLIQIFVNSSISDLP